MAVAYASNLFTVSPNTSTAGTGTITATATTVTINSVTYTATQVTGVGTAFTTQLVRGSLLSMSGFTDMIVYSIASNTSLIALKQDYTTNAQVIGTATAFTFRAPTFWTDLVASVTATALPAVASTDGRLNIAFTASSVTIQANAVLICADNVNMSFGNASGYRLNIASAGSLILRNGGHITYNGSVGFSFFAGTIDCWSGRFTYQANQTVASSRQDFFDPNTMNSHFISAMDVVFSGGASGCSTFIHLERLGGKVSELKMFNQMSLAGALVLIQFNVGTYPNVTFPSATSSLGFVPNLGVYLARSGGTSTLVKPVFPGSSYSISNPGISGSAYIIDESWPDNGGAVGTLTYPSGSTTIYRQFTWFPGTYHTEGGWNVYLRDNQGTPAVVQSGVVTANTGLLMTWQRTTGTVTNYGPFKLTARKAGYIGKYETFTPVAPRTESFLPVVDATYTSDQSGLTGISGNNSSNTIASSASMTLDQRYDWFQYWMALTPQMVAYGGVARVDSVNGTEWSLPSGWTDSVTAGTLSAGTKLTYEYAPTFTVSGSGAITSIYASSAGTSTILELRNIKPGASYIVANNATKATILYGVNNETTAQDYSVQFPPGSAGTKVYVARKALGDFFDFEVITLEPGLIWHAFVDIPDEGAKETNATALNAYTELEANTKVYNYVTGIYMRTEEGIKLGEFFSREGTFLKWAAPYSVLIKQSASSLFSKSGNLFTIKASGLDADANYDTNVLTAPATMTADTNEVIGTEIIDANGDSSLTIQGGSGNYEIWKVANGTAEDQYETGTLLAATVGLGKWRFTGTSGFYLLVRDKAKNNRDTCSMAKGTYTIGLYAGKDQITVAQLPEVYEIQDSLALMQIDIDGKPTLPQMEASTVLAMKAQIDALQALINALPQAGQVVDANIVKVNGVAVDGTGSESDPWGPV